jgi:uncharacterized protein with HEPN domain
MSDKAGRVPDYLGHILRAIERIDRYMAGLDETGFLKNELVQDGVVRNIEIIGEASNRIKKASPDFVARHDGISWLGMYNMRNRISHGYDDINLKIVWNVTQTDLPVLRRQVARVMEAVCRAADDSGG